MASIDIPMGPGGQAATINVPDFAMESTQKQLLDALQNIAGGQASTQASNRGVSQGDQQVKAAIKDLARKTEKENSRSFKQGVQNTRNVVGAVGRNAKSALEGGSSGFTSLFKNLGLGMLSTQFGMVAGLAEDLGNSLSYGGRIGLSFGDDLVRTSGDLADVGLSIGDFASVVGGNIKAMRLLGDSVESGSQRFIGMNIALREASHEFGNFGMSSMEMSQFLADEIEMRRRVMTADEMRLMTEKDLVDAMKSNLVNQERMAQVTGQDVQERIKAQMAARSSQQGSMFLSGANSAQRDAFNQSTGNLSQFGELEPQMRDALGYLLNGQDGLAAQSIGGENMAAMPGLMDALKQQAELIKSGASADNIDQAFLNRLMAMRDAGLGGAGMDSNLEFMATFNASLGPMLDLFRTMAEINPGSMKDLKDNAAIRQAEIGDKRGLTAAQESMVAEGKQLVNRFVVAMMGGADNNVIDSYRSFVDSLNEGFNNPNVVGTIDALGKAFGRVGIQPWVAFIDGVATNSQKAKLMGDALTAIGAPSSVAGMLAAGEMAGAFAGFATDMGNLPGLDGTGAGNVIGGIGSALEGAMNSLGNALNVIVLNPITNAIPGLPLPPQPGPAPADS